MALKDVRHVLWMACILMGVAAVALIVRAQFVPPTFGQYGSYRGASVRQIRDRPVKYHGVENCRACHEEQWKQWRESSHNSVSCETCHGPGMEHSKPDVDPRPKILGTKVLMARSHDLCLSCHAKTPGRRANFPQVDSVEHLTRYSITEKDASDERLITTGDSADSAEEEDSIRTPAEDTPPAVEHAAGEPLPEEYSCKFCHGKEGMLAEAEDTQHLIVTEEHMVGDVHWQKGLRCHDCHGGNPMLDDYTDHRDDPGFRALESPAEIPEFCGRCHSDNEYMKRYQSSPKTDQVEAYWASVHGKHLKSIEDPAAAEGAEPVTCLSCHLKHGMRAVDDPRSAAHPSRLAKTCGHCHFNVEYMRRYQPSPRIGRTVEYLAARHGQRLREDGDRKAATCVTCHGHHAIQAIDPLVSPDNCVPCHKGHTPLR